MADPIPLDLARKRKVRDETPPDETEACPVVALGHENGKAFFLDIAGVERCLAARALGSRSDLLMLFGGNPGWLENEFPQRRIHKEMVAGEVVETVLETSFNASAAAAYLMRQAFAAGIYGPHITIRKPGIWRDAQGRPAVHCGNEVLIGGEWHKAGSRIDGTVWVGGWPMPRPAPPCGPEIGRGFQSEVERLWTFKSPAAGIICTGLVGTSLLGAAPEHRPSGFLRAEPASGKTMLMNAMRACAPVHHYTNDTSAAGVMGAMNGKAMPVYIDEPTDRVDQEGAQKLMDLVLASSGGEGVKGHRGTADGGVRSIEMVGTFLYGAVSPPELQPQHFRRITMIDLVKPEGGADHKDQMLNLTTRMKQNAPALWGRILAHWPEWLQAAAAYRNALAAVGCTAGEMDQMSAILAGWWIMTEDGIPDARQARTGVIAIRDFVRVAEDVADDSGPRRVMEALLSARVQYDGTTRQEQVGALLTRVFARNDAHHDASDARSAEEALARYGVRVVCANDIQDRRGYPVPRLGDGDGIWLMPSVVRGLFHGGRYEGDRWRTELLRLPTSAGPSKFNVRIGGVSGKPIWIGRGDIDPAEPVTFADLLRILALQPPQLLGLIDHPRFPVAQRIGMVTDWLFDAGKVTAFVDRLRAAPETQ